MQVDLTQNSPSWLTWRESGIGASDVPTIMGLSPFQSAFSLWLAKTGQSKAKSDNDAMVHGRSLEEFAREMLIEKTGNFYLPACFESDQRPWLRASVDCWLSAAVPGAEIKCPTQDIDHVRTAKEKRVPDHYMAQIQAQMYVTGHKKWLYVSYYEGDLATVEVVRDDFFIGELMLPACDSFWTKVQKKDWPLPTGERGTMDEEIIMLMRRAVDAQVMKREAEEMERSALAQLSRRLDAKTTSAGGYEATWNYRNGYQEKQPRTVPPSLSLRVRRVKDRDD